MGADGSKPAHHVQVRLERPQQKTLPEGLYILAGIHSAAEGFWKYLNWDEPQSLGLWADDIITVSLYAAESERHFDDCQYEDIAELYLPWEYLRTQPGQEAVFELGLSGSAPKLGHNASQLEYQEAFKRSCDEIKANPGMPRMRIGVREVEVADDSGILKEEYDSQLLSPQYEGSQGLDEDSIYESPGPPRDVAPAPRSLPQPRPQEMHRPSPTPWTNEEPGADDEHQLYHLQVRNEKLYKQCAALGLRDVDVPQVAEQEVQARVDWLNHASAENNQLRLDMQDLERELTHIWGGGGLAAQGEWAAQGEEDEYACDRIVQEIRATINQNIALKEQTEGDLLKLEESIYAARCQRAPGSEGADADPRQDQQRELQVIMQECSTLEAHLQEADKATEQFAEMQSRQKQELELENKRLKQEVENSYQILNDRPSQVGAEITSATMTLETEVENLRYQLEDKQRRLAEERVEMEQRPSQFRREKHVLSERLRETSGDIEAAERELEELQRSHEQVLQELRSTSVERAAAVRQREEAQMSQNTLANEVNRTKIRINFHDKKIEHLQSVERDLQERARSACLTVRESPGTNGDDSQMVAFQELLQQHHHQAQKEEVLRRERDEAQRDLEEALVEAKVIEQKMLFLRDRTAAIQGYVQD